MDDRALVRWVRHGGIEFQAAEEEAVAEEDMFHISCFFVWLLFVFVLFIQYESISVNMLMQ